MKVSAKTGRETATDAPGVADAQAVRRRARWALIVLFALMSAPVVGAWLMFYLGQDWLSLGTVNQGELIVPARPLTDAAIVDSRRDRINHTAFNHYWTLLYVGPSACDSSCLTALYHARQVRLAVGKDLDRVATGYLVTDSDPVQDFAQWGEGFPALRVLYAADGEVIDRFRVGDEPVERAQRRIYLVDPLGNIMMRYRPGQDAAAMLKDLKRLLKVSALR